MKILSFFALLLSAVLVLAQNPLYVREVVVEGSSTKELTCKLDFFIPLSCKSYRLVNQKGKEFGTQEILRRGSKVRIFFNAKSGQKYYLAFYKDKVKNLACKQISGVLREVKKCSARNIRNLKHFEKLWKSNKLLGARFEKRIYSGWNPFGPREKSLHRFSAFVKIPVSGKWTFFSASTDASFILVDGKLVVNSPGRKWVRTGQEGKIRGSIELSKGIHHLEYLHANFNQDHCYAIAAMLAPGASKKKFRVIGEEAFTPVLTAKTGQLQTFSRKFTCDFSWQIVDMIEINEKNMYVVKYSTPCKPPLTWSNGNKNNEFNYFYFETGDYDVNLKCATGKISMKVIVEKQFMLKPIGKDKLKEYIKQAFDQENTSGIQKEGYSFLTEAMIKLKMFDEANKYYKYLLSKQKLVPPEITFKLFNELLLERLLKNEKYSIAERHLRQLYRQITSPELKSIADLAFAELYFYRLGELKKCQKHFLKIKLSLLNNETLKRRYNILNADLTLTNDGLEKAAEKYRKIKTASKFNSNKSQLLISGTMIAIRNCYVMKKYNTALEHTEKLESVFPEVRLEPAYLLLKAKLYIKLKQPLRAVQTFLRIFKTEPSVSVSASSNWELAKFYYNQRQYLPARKRLLNILNNAPRSREAAEASKLLAKLDTELR